MAKKQVTATKRYTLTFFALAIYSDKTINDIFALAVPTYVPYILFFYSSSVF